MRAKNEDDFIPINAIYFTLHSSRIIPNSIQCNEAISFSLLLWCGSYFHFSVVLLMLYE